jgi:hypothetical protein
VTAHVIRPGADGVERCACGRGDWSTEETGAVVGAVQVHVGVEPPWVGEGPVLVVTLDPGGTAEVTSVADSAGLYGLLIVADVDYQTVGVMPLADDLDMWVAFDSVVPQEAEVVNWPAMHVAARFAGRRPLLGAVVGSVVFTGGVDARGATVGLSQARFGWLLGQLARDHVLLTEVGP